MDHVDATLKRWRSTPFSWSDGNDCLLRIADYVCSRTGDDWGAIFRGTYANEAGAMAHVGRYGGAKYLIDRSGLSHVSRPARGDILLMRIGDGEVAALCTGDGAAAGMPRGVVEIDLRFVKIICAWKVP